MVAVNQGQQMGEMACIHMDQKNGVQSFVEGRYKVNHGIRHVVGKAHKKSIGDAYAAVVAQINGVPRDPYAIALHALDRTINADRPSPVALDFNLQTSPYVTSKQRHAAIYQAAHRIMRGLDAQTHDTAPFLPGQLDQLAARPRTGPEPGPHRGLGAKAAIVPGLPSPHKTVRTQLDGRTPPRPNRAQTPPPQQAQQQQQQRADAAMKLAVAGAARVRAGSARRLRAPTGGAVAPQPFLRDTLGYIIQAPDHYRVAQLYDHKPRGTSAARQRQQQLQQQQQQQHPAAPGGGDAARRVPPSAQPVPGVPRPASVHASYAADDREPPPHHRERSLSPPRAPGALGGGGALPKYLSDLLYSGRGDPAPAARARVPGAPPPRRESHPGGGYYAHAARDDPAAAARHARTPRERRDDRLVTLAEALAATEAAAQDFEVAVIKGQGPRVFGLALALEAVEADERETSLLPPDKRQPGPSSATAAAVLSALRDGNDRQLSLNEALPGGRSRRLDWPAGSSPLETFEPVGRQTPKAAAAAAPAARKQWDVPAPGTPRKGQVQDVLTARLSMA